MSTQSSIRETLTQNAEFKWSHSANWLLINNYLDIVDEFRDPRTTNKELWGKISERFHDVGHDIPPELCEKRFRHLKATYFQVKDRKQQTPNIQIRWEYYKIFDEIIKGDEAHAANLTSNNTSTPSTDPRMAKKRKRVVKPNKPQTQQENKNNPNNTSNASNATNSNNSNTTTTTKPVAPETTEEDANSSKVHDIDDDTIDDEEFILKGLKDPNSITISLAVLEARKLHAETKYFNKKAEYFEKQSEYVEVQQKLTIMQAHKLKLEIDQMADSVIQ